MHELWGSDLAPLIFVAFFGVVAAVVYPIAQGVRRRLEGRAGADLAALRDAMDQLRVEVAELRAGGADVEMTARLTELEERVDFTERLLARGGERQEG